jgi:hypothetical protein
MIQGFAHRVQRAILPFKGEIKHQRKAIYRLVIQNVTVPPGEGLDMIEIDTGFDGL